jgi:hypothetical protein
LNFFPAARDTLSELPAMPAAVEGQMTSFVFEKIKWTYNPDSASDAVDPLVVTWDGKDTRMHTDAEDLRPGDGSVGLPGTTDVPAPSDFFVI